MRSFLALTPSEAAIDAILDIQEGMPGAHWAPPENLHLTLLFLGDQPRRALEDLDAALLKVDAAPFDLALQGVGAFGGRDARLVFAGVAESEPLRRLQAKLVGAARSAEMEVDHRRFSPHVTLARWGRNAVSAERLAAYIQARSLFRTEPFEVARFGLFRSELGRGGAHYDLMAEYELSTPQR